MIPCLVSSYALSSEGDTFSAWVTYWDPEGSLEEAEQFGDSLTTLVFFAAYFDEECELYVPGQIDDLIEDANSLFEGNLPERYLSVVNDILLAEGESSLKDWGLLWALLGSPESRQKHVDELIALTRFYKMDGIEIDYEAFKGDLDLWRNFLAFLSLLYEEAQTQGLKLRVLLEPSAPLSALVFPGGPSYVMMCYNLYGDHGQPGPKADDAFLRTLVHDMKALPGEKGFALATGGFHWVNQKSTRSLRQNEAEAIASAYGRNPMRDAASGSLYFDYLDEQGDLNTVWYADGETLRRWRNVIAENGKYAISIWRLGGNSDLSALVTVAEAPAPD